MHIRAQTWQEVAKVQHQSAAIGDRMGHAVSLHDQLAAVGIPYDDTASSIYNGKGSVSVYTWSGAWSLSQQITVPAPGYLPRFGWDLDLQDSLLVVGACADATDQNGNHPMNASGAVFVFGLDTGGDWQLQQKLTASDRAADDYFGWAVRVDGNRMIIGARFESHDAMGQDSLYGAGSAYIFERQAGGTWVQQQKIVASDRGKDDSFGVAVDISGDHALIGAWLEDHDTLGQDSMSMSGSAYVFKRATNGWWQEAQKLTSPDRSSGELFGGAVVLEDSTLLIGCQGDGEDATGSNYLSYSGAVYVFDLDQSGAWGFGQKLVASDRNMQDAFGNSLDMDEDRILIGSFQDDPPGQPFNMRYGSAYLFERDMGGVFLEKAKLTASDGSDPDRFGQSVALHGAHAMAGAPFKQAERGAVYFFREDTLTGSWQSLTVSEPEVYPNPCHDMLYVKCRGEMTGAFTYRLSDLSGRTVLSGVLADGSQPVPMHSLHSGLYFLYGKAGNLHFHAKVLKR